MRLKDRVAGNPAEREPELAAKGESSDGGARRSLSYGAKTTYGATLQMTSAPKKPKGSPRSGPGKKAQPGRKKRKGAIPGTRDLADAAASRGVNGGGRSLERILQGGLAALSRHGATLLSMSDVCEAGGFSRATLYRYFSRKEDLLEAVGEYVSQSFINGWKTAGDGAVDSIDRLRRILQFTWRHTAQTRADRIFEVEPGFVLRFLQSHFEQHIAAFNDALAPVYDDLERRLGMRLNRLLVSEVLLRGQESTNLIPAGATWNSLPEALPALMSHFIGVIEKPARKQQRG